jgi:hypothetical protein
MRADDLRFRRSSFVPGNPCVSSSLPDTVATGSGAVPSGVVAFPVPAIPGGRAYRGWGAVKSSLTASISPLQYSHADLNVGHMVGGTSSVGALSTDVCPVVSGCGAMSLVETVGRVKPTKLPSLQEISSLADTLLAASS